MQRLHQLRYIILTLGISQVKLREVRRIHKVRQRSRIHHIFKPAQCDERRPRAGAAHKVCDGGVRRIFFRPLGKVRQGVG